MATENTITYNRKNQCSARRSPRRDYARLGASRAPSPGLGGSRGARRWAALGGAEADVGGAEAAQGGVEAARRRLSPRKFGPAARRAKISRADGAARRARGSERGKDKRQRKDSRVPFSSPPPVLLAADEVHPPDPDELLPSVLLLPFSSLSSTRRSCSSSSPARP
jgi:hypothetical protein